MIREFQSKSLVLGGFPFAVGVFLLLMLNSFAAWSVVVDKEPRKNEDTLEKRLIDSNIYISEWFDSVSDGLDMFLTGKRITSRPNETRAVISNASYYNEVEKFNTNTTLDVELRLPNLEEYWQLKFSSYDEKQERAADRATLLKGRRETNYGASLGLFKKLGNVRTAFQPRVGLQDPLDVSHSLSFESIADLKSYKVNPKLEFYANAKKGVGIVQALNFNFTLTKIFSLTVVNEGDYEEKRHLYSVSNGISLGQFLTKKTSLAYAWFFGSSNQPNYHLDGYTIAVGWSHILYARILDYKLTPHIDFSRDRGFVGLPGISCNINLNF